jgi:acylphosphatase
MQLTRAHLLIDGHVQGVFFRASVRDVARNVGCTGWVANRAGGRVEMEVQGSRDAVQRVIDFCHTGPQQANVTNVEVRYTDPVEDETGFGTR